MIGEGWSFRDLMAMSARDFAFWFAEQDEASRRRAETLNAGEGAG